MNEDNIRNLLVARLGPDCIFSGDDIGEKFRTDIMGKYRARPAALSRPRSTEQVADILKLASANGWPVTVVGGQTGTSGGAVPSDGGIALSLDRMNQVEEIDLLSMTMTVQAGCILQAAQEAAEAENAMLPLDLGARGSATIGGVIGTNAGGNRVLRWGMMRDMVIGLEVVLADGTVVSSMTKMIKDNAGYHWKHLMIGSEGTLGIVTRAVLRLRPLPTTHDTALVAIGDFAQAAALLRRLEVKLSGRLSSFELMWNDFYQQMTEAQRARRPRPLPDSHFCYALVEAMGGDAEGDGAQFERVLAAEIEAGNVEDVVIAQSAREREALWAVREDMEVGLEPLKPFTVYDISMALSDMGGFVDAVRPAVLGVFPDAQMLFYGHAGDGNLHIIIHVGPDGAQHAGTVERIVYEEVRKVGGSISGEHGIGQSRLPYLALTRSDAEMQLMRTLKDALDPGHILNPGKLLG